MDLDQVPEEAVERYSHRESSEFEELKGANTQMKELFDRLEEESGQSIESHPVESEHPYFSMLGSLSVPGEMDVRVLYPKQVSTGEEPWEWRKKTSDMAIEKIYPDADTGNKLDTAVEERIPHDSVIDIHGENITNGGELLAGGISRLTEPQRTYRILSYSDVEFPEEEAIKQIDNENPTAAKIANQEIHQKSLAITTVIIEQQNALVETDYIPPTYDMFNDGSDLF